MIMVMIVVIEIEVDVVESKCFFEKILLSEVNLLFLFCLNSLSINR